MTRFLEVACGVSALVLANGAHAAGGFQLTFTNELPSFCKIGVEPAYSLNSEATVTNTGAGSATVDFGASFSNPDATGGQLSGSVRFTVYATAKCAYALTSAYGALKNITAGQTGAFRDYYADAYDVSGSGTPIHLNSLSSYTLVNQFTIAAPNWWKQSTVAVEFQIPKTSSPLAAGQYQDVLSLTVYPSI